MAAGSLSEVLGKKAESAMDDAPDSSEGSGPESSDTQEELRAMKLFESASSPEKKVRAMKLFLKACGY